VTGRVILGTCVSCHSPYATVEDEYHNLLCMDCHQFAVLTDCYDDWAEDDQ
jgi:hypothetical protein